MKYSRRRAMTTTKKYCLLTQFASPFELISNFCEKQVIPDSFRPILDVSEGINEDSMSNIVDKDDDDSKSLSAKLENLTICSSFKIHAMK